jgi:hypothetical protein
MKNEPFDEMEIEANEINEQHVESQINLIKLKVVKSLNFFLSLKTNSFKAKTNSFNFLVG